MNSMLAPRNTVKGDRVEFYVCFSVVLLLSLDRLLRQKSQAIEL